MWTGRPLRGRTWISSRLASIAAVEHGHHVVCPKAVKMRRMPRRRKGKRRKPSARRGISAMTEMYHHVHAPSRSARRANPSAEIRRSHRAGSAPSLSTKREYPGWIPVLDGGENPIVEDRGRKANCSWAGDGRARSSAASVYIPPGALAAIPCSRRKWGQPLRFHGRRSRRHRGARHLCAPLADECRRARPRRGWAPGPARALHQPCDEDRRRHVPAGWDSSFQRENWRPVYGMAAEAVTC